MTRLADMEISPSPETRDDMRKAKDQLARLKQTVRDIRYIIKQYGRRLPQEAFETIEKLINDPKLRTKSLKGGK